MNKKKVNIQVDFLSSKNMFNIILPAIQNGIGRTYPTYSFFLLFTDANYTKSRSCPCKR